MEYIAAERIPLVVAPCRDFEADATAKENFKSSSPKYILFEYGDRMPVAVPAGSTTSGSNAKSGTGRTSAASNTETARTQSPLPSPGASSILFRTELDSVPDHLKPYLVPYAVSSDPRDPPSATAESTRRRLSATNLPIHLRNLAVIDSTYSGSHKSSDLYFAILLPLLKAFGLAHVYVATTGPSTISNHAKSFSSSSTVVLMAGDTSVHEFVNSLTETREKLRLNVVVIPTGTGNALSVSIGHNSVAHAISRLFTGQAEPLSNMKVEFPPESSLIIPTDPSNPAPIQSLQSLVVTSWAFHAALVADSDSPEYRAQGPGRFALAARANLEDKDQNYEGTITYNSNGKSRVLAGPHSYVLFTLVNRLEKSFPVSPDSNPAASGDLHLVQFNHLEGPSIMEIMQKVYNNSSHIKDPRVTYEKVDHGTPSSVIATLQVDNADPIYRRCCVDGRIIIVPAHGTIKIYEPTRNYNGWDLYIVK
ncbi:putative sphingosine kinase-like protein [Sugiyamaella lignohabitans]|uniref:Putative sphingosine kinase-like protein n=1 Tax=Sugiyamaella lignohabitans TaxID=796027 RepID=A0A167EMD7_9ASCO|nr:putative sphingosine kinase-like protein [Sugiyamaella lignohabitans]ANB14249.1 putative sphingosine kinase-like protein [Sugiyamaella lignohabitans]